MKREIAIQGEGANCIFFWATPDAADDMKHFGSVQSWSHENQYMLTVDPRFDFQEIRKYILNYGKMMP